MLGLAADWRDGAMACSIRSSAGATPVRSSAEAAARERPERSSSRRLTGSSGFPFIVLSLGCHRQPRANLVLLGELLECRLADVDHHLDNLASECERRFVLVRDRRDRVAADIEGLVHGEVAVYLLLETSLTDVLLAQSKSHRAPSAGLSLLVDLDFRGEH